MNFLQFANIWTLIFPVAVLLYYFFRKRYTPKTISSTLFWESFMNETKASPYFEKLQKNLLLLLQLLALLLFVFLLMKPYLPSSSSANEDIWLVIDTSASMETKSGDTTWFEQQKARMQAIVNSNEGATFTIVQTGETPAFVVQNETNRQQLLAAIDSLDVTYEAEQLKKTFDFVKAGLPKEGASVYVLTDAASKDLVTFDQENVSWRVENRKETPQNIAIKQFGVSPSEDGTNAIVEIQNDTDEVATGSIDFVTLKDDVVATIDYEVAANERGIVSTVLPSDDSFFKAKLKEKDDYETDNEMTAILYRPVMQVAVDDAVHPTIQKALLAIGADVVTVPTEDLTLRPAGELLVTSDESLLEDAEHPVLLIGREDKKLQEVAGSIAQKANFSNYVDLSDVYVQSVYPSIEGATTIAAIDDKPFIQQLANGNLVVLADIDQTDWPLHPSYPLFLWAAMEQFSEDAETIGSYFPNDRVTLASRYNEWSIYSADESFIGDITPDGSMTVPTRPGFYQVTDGETSKVFAVSLEQHEKQLPTEKSFEIGSYQAGGEKEVQQSMLPIGLLIIFVLLLLEWEVQRRRGFTT